MKVKELDLQQEFSIEVRTMEQLHQASNGLPDEPHRHNYYTVICCDNATGYHAIDFNTYTFGQKQLHFVSPGQVHQVHTTTPPKGIVVVFTDAFLTQHSIRKSLISNYKLFNDCSDSSPIQVPEENWQAIQNAANNLQQTYTQSSTFHADKLGALLKLFLIECAEIFTTQKNTSNLQQQSVTDLVNAFKNAVENSFRHWHKVQEYAQELHVNPTYLNEVVKQTIGQSAKEYILQRIALEAKREAIHSSITSKELAFELGFNDQAHFAKFFKQQSGISFSEFKKQIQA